MNAPSVTEMRLQGRKLLIARALWLGLTVLAIGLYLINLPIEYASYHTLCTTASCWIQQLTPELARQFTQQGLSVDAYALYVTIISTLQWLVFVIVGVIIFWRRPDDQMALYVSQMLILWQSRAGPSSSSAVNPLLRLSVMLVTVLGGSAIALFFFIFPDRRFVPRWTRWLAPLIVLREVLTVLLPDIALIQDLFLAFVPFALLAQIYRYRRVSTIFQRQQTKWVVFGLTIGIIGFVGTILIYALLYSNGQPGNIVASVLAVTLINLCWLCVPLSIGVAILRSHLWDIDVLIRRTVTYTVVVALLAALYFASVILLQQIFAFVTGQHTEIITVLSTLAIVALFVPLRNRVQAVIDKRFYRNRYDARKVLEQFAQEARDETDLERLTADLMSVVQETMQPESVSLWLRDKERRP